MDEPAEEGILVLIYYSKSSLWTHSGLINLYSRIPSTRRFGGGGVHRKLETPHDIGVGG